jgi:hypothetical protein
LFLYFCWLLCYDLSFLLRCYPCPCGFWLMYWCIWYNDDFFWYFDVFLLYFWFFLRFVFVFCLLPFWMLWWLLGLLLLLVHWLAFHCCLSSWFFWSCYFVFRILFFRLNISCNSFWFHYISMSSFLVVLLVFMFWFSTWFLVMFSICAMHPNLVLEIVPRFFNFCWLGMTCSIQSMMPWCEYPFLPLYLQV